MTRRLLAITVLAMLGVLAVPAATAHGAPDPRGQDTRLLADHNDDCGGHSATEPERCNGTHDLVALDVVEAYDAALGDVVRFRFTLNAGTPADGLRDVFTFKAGSIAKSLELRTTNNEDFTGSGFDAVSKAVPAKFPSGSTDGTRFIVEATVKASSLGGVGTKLSDYRIEAFRGAGKGDYVPGGYVNALGVTDANPPQGDGATNYVAGAYTLRGPTYYASFTGQGMEVQAGAMAMQTVQVANRLASGTTSGLNAKWDTAQTVTLGLVSAGAATATWQDGSTTLMLDVAEGGTVPAMLHVTGVAAGSATLTVTMTTNLGGRTVHTIPVQVTAASTGPSTSSPHPTDGEGAPAPAAALVGLGLLALAGLRRRT